MWGRDIWCWGRNIAWRLAHVMEKQENSNVMAGGVVSRQRNAMH